MQIESCVAGREFLAINAKPPMNPMEHINSITERRRADTLVKCALQMVLLKAVGQRECPSLLQLHPLGFQSSSTSTLPCLHDPQLLPPPLPWR
jgi:hypothetical protein